MTDSQACVATSESLPKTVGEIELVKRLTQYIDHNFVIIDRAGLKENFFPLLGLGAIDCILEASFGFNTEGRFFSMIICKTSKSNESIGLFNLSFYLERHQRTNAGYFVFFEARNGRVFGRVPNDNAGIVNIYDISRGGFLTTFGNGKIVDCLDSKYGSINYSLASLINAGKTIGYIFEQHLETRESLGQGGFKYTKRALTSHYLPNPFHNGMLKVRFD